MNEPTARSTASRWLLAASILTSPSLIGCGGGTYNASVSGTVSLDGEPIGPGVVTFAPDDAKLNPSKGNILDNGRYTLETKHEEGIDAGVYRVAVQAFEAGKTLAPGERSNEPSVPLVPQKYMKVSTSGLSFEVQPGSQSIDIALTSD